MRRLPLAVAVLALVACKSRHEPEPRPAPGPSTGSAAPVATSRYDAIARADFNRFAVRQNLPVFWIADTNQNHALDPDEVASLLFYPTTGHWVDHGAFTPEFATAYAQIVAASKAAAPTDPRVALVDRELDAGRATLLVTHTASLSPEDQKLVAHVRTLADQIDKLYEVQNGAAALADKLPADVESHSLFRRNRGSRCIAPETTANPQCSAIPGSPRPIVDIYPVDVQTSDGFCKPLEARPDAKALLEPFTVVRKNGDKLEAVPYATAYADKMKPIADELDAAAKDTTSAPLTAYLHAAAQSFRTNDWVPADEAWAKMTVDNSTWYVRFAPDEVYWDPCFHKAGFHLTFAKINQGSREWQQKLVPVQQEMEAAVAAHAGPPYKVRTVKFHLPDFIDIVINAGDDRTGLGITAGESLPNFGPVAAESRGRTVAMVNVGADPDSREARRVQAASVLDAESMKLYSGSREATTLVTILHEATHNLGPAQEYKVDGKPDDQIFGGTTASMLEELKAQTGGVFLVEFLRGKGLISDELARQSYADAIVWACGHISQGMYTGSHQAKPYGNLAAIQVGFLLEHGALEWNEQAVAANGTDKGALVIHPDKLVGAIDEMMKTVAGIKARGDKAGAAALIAKYVDDTKIVPHKAISERYLRIPKQSFVYALEP